MPYYPADSGSGLGDWRAEIAGEGMAELIAESSASSRGSFDEDLIRYVRPITWDASLRYEFEWQPGVCEVHPSVGRSVFLIRPSGVELHRLTVVAHGGIEVEKVGNREPFIEAELAGM